MIHHEPELGAVVSDLRARGWIVRPNPIMKAVTAVQLSLVLTLDGQRYVDVLVLRYNAPAIYQRSKAEFNDDFPFEHNVEWEELLPVEDAFDYALRVSPPPRANPFPGAQGQLAAAEHPDPH